MTVESVMSLGYQVLATAFWSALPVLAAGMIVGLFVAVFQAATQIQEASLNFVPKLLGMAAALVMFGGWIINKLMTFTVTLFNRAADIGAGF